MSTTPVKDIVREKYGQAASRVAEGAASACCGGAAASGRAAIRSPPISTMPRRPASCPRRALRASLGCGNPTALAELKPGETVLDLGSGGGIDVLLSARRVGPAGKAYGLDMTDEMLALAEENKRKSGLTNVEFLKGEIEHIPLPDNSVDVIISNCVINLSGDKDRVLKEAFRVLKPGGRFAVSDVVVRGAVPDPIKRSMELWVGCVAGALTDYEYVAKLTQSRLRAHRDRADAGLQHRRCAGVSRRRGSRRRCAGQGRRGQVHQRLRSGDEERAGRMLRPDLLRLTGAGRSGTGRSAEVSLLPFPFLVTPALPVRLLDRFERRPHDRHHRVGEAREGDAGRERDRGFNREQRRRQDGGGGATGQMNDVRQAVGQHGEAVAPLLPAYASGD